MGGYRLPEETEGSILKAVECQLPTGDGGCGGGDGAGLVVCTTQKCS